jgi:hypothetical protein
MLLYSLIYIMLVSCVKINLFLWGIKDRVQRRKTYSDFPVTYSATTFHLPGCFLH